MKALRSWCWERKEKTKSKRVMGLDGGLSWADQWDYNPDPPPSSSSENEKNKNKNGSSGKSKFKKTIMSFKWMKELRKKSDKSWKKNRATNSIKTGAWIKLCSIDIISSNQNFPFLLICVLSSLFVISSEWQKPREKKQKSFGFPKLSTNEFIILYYIILKNYASVFFF